MSIVDGMRDRGNYECQICKAVFHIDGKIPEDGNEEILCCPFCGGAVIDAEERE